MRIILITILLFAATSLFAQKTRHISVEILGAQNTVSTTTAVSKVHTVWDTG